MVDIRVERERETRIAKGHTQTGGIVCSVYFNTELFNQLRAEAISRGWPMSRLIRHLCEASIDGIP
jgi:hypothetical protein